VNAAAFAIHSSIHRARPEANAAAHSHSTYGRAWSAFGQPLDPLTQDACAFYRDHAVYNDFGGVAVEEAEGVRITQALGSGKAVILQNHGLLTVGNTVDEAAFWFIKMERVCQIQLLVEAAAANGRPVRHVRDDMARQSAALIGTNAAGWYEFQPLYARIVAEEPDLLR
jgi:ribulose-5-phosphate 4-epimerase/fuculose-1-phosphate aldolase